MGNNSLDKARKNINEIDREMAELFVKRMRAVEKVLEYKRENGLPIFDADREKEIIERGESLIDDVAMRDYYIDFLRSNMEISKKYQRALLVEANSNESKSTCTKIRIDLSDKSYDISIGRGLIDHAGEIFDLQRKVIILTDSGVPKEYSKKIAELSLDAKIIVVNEGEESKGLEVFSGICKEMLDFGITRKDCLVAVGGGVVGDLGGFCASSFMRGIDFYNVPTTLLSQVDASVGGKCAINLSGVKNIVGAFYQPKAVLIDPDTLKTLPERHISNGFAELIKMSLTSDKELFEVIEKCEDIEDILDEIIVRSIKIKKSIVEQDERESGLRKILNFGHTLGHGIEAEEGLSGLYHGECVALGMIPVCSAKVREQLYHVLKKVGLPTEYKADLEGALSFIKHDKKCDGGLISVIFVDEIGKYRIEKIDVESFCSLVRKELK